MHERRRFFDSHLDLAMMERLGRDMLAPAATQDRPDPPCAVTLPELTRARVTHALATIFIEPHATAEMPAKDAPIGYVAGDAESASRAGWAQARVYQRWMDESRCVHFVTPDALDGGANAGAAPLRLGVLIEGADCLREPAELDAWCEALPIVAVGMAWATASRYAGGNTTDLGLTPLGVELARRIDERGLVHDVSHLSDRALAELMEIMAPTGRVIASHSNCRALLGDATNQRHITDAQIKAIAARGGGSGGGGGVIGLNLYSKFLVPACAPSQRATLVQTLAHVDHVTQLTGSARHVGLGTDADGGFSAARLPEGIDAMTGLARLAEALAAAPFRWSEADVEGFCWGNWARFFGLADGAGAQ